MSHEVLIKLSSLPPRPPIGFAILFWLLLDRLNAPGWVFGVLWTLVALMAIVFVRRVHKATFRDVPGFGKK